MGMNSNQQQYQKQGTPNVLNMVNYVTNNHTTTIHNHHYHQQPNTTTAKPTGPVKYYDKCILSDKSQFSFKGGEASCTYICLKVAEYFLTNYKKMRHYCRIIDEDFMNKSGLHLDMVQQQHVMQMKQHLIDDIEHIMTVGVLYDKHVGHRSCDEVFETVDHYKQTLSLGKMFIGKLRDSTVFMQALKEVELMSQNKERNFVTAMVFTKPPETIAILHDGFSSFKGDEKYYSWYVFDSHPRNYEKGKGGGFYIFKDIQDVDKHLKQLFANDVNFYDQVYQGDQYQVQSHVMYEATIVELKNAKTRKSTEDITAPTTIETPQPSQQQQLLPPVGNPVVVPIQTPQQTLTSEREATLLKRLNELEQKVARQEEEIKTMNLLLGEERSYGQQLQNENAKLRNQILTMATQTTKAPSAHDTNLIDKLFGF